MSLLEAKAAAAACHKQRVLLLEPPSEALPTPLDPATGIRKPSSDIAHLQQLIAEVLSLSGLIGLMAYLLSLMVTAFWHDDMLNMRFTAALSAQLQCNNSSVERDVHTKT